MTGQAHIVRWYEARFDLFARKQRAYDAIPQHKLLSFKEQLVRRTVFRGGKQQLQSPSRAKQCLGPKLDGSVCNSGMLPGNSKMWA